MRTRRENRKNDGADGDDAVGMVAVVAGPRILRAGYDKPADRGRHNHRADGGKERLEAIVVVAVLIVRGGEREISPIGPE